MPRQFDILTEYGFDNSDKPRLSAPDTLSSNPFAIVAVWRYRHPVTYSRNLGRSFDRDVERISELRNDVEPFLIIDDIRNLSVSSSKGSSTDGLTVTLSPRVNYLTEIMPGDWIMAWIVHSLDVAQSLIERLRGSAKGNDKACNYFFDGLKFVGRATDIRKSIRQSPDGGRSSIYSVRAAAFQELDAQTYQDPHLQQGAVDVSDSQFLYNLGIRMNELMVEGVNGIDVNKALPKLLEVFYGKGIRKNFGADTNVSVTEGLDDPNAFIIPKQIASVLGVEKGTKDNGRFGYCDILEFLHGVQRYGLNTVNNEAIHRNLKTKSYQNAAEIAGKAFTPDGVPSDGATRHRATGTPMLGKFLPNPPQMSGSKTVMSILHQFLNDAVNEMYTCLRSNPQGRIMPTLVARQLPFSSAQINKMYAPKNISLPDEPLAWVPDPTPPIQGPVRNPVREVTITSFMELPRWQIHPILVKSVDIGRSDATRFNFIHVYGEAGGAGTGPIHQMVQSPPVVDELDINRSGMRMYAKTINCAPEDTTMAKAGEWMYILSDILMGQHLLLNGSIDIFGVQSPICPGDNIEFDSHVFHIESVSHTFNISNDGTKSFDTNLTLTHGKKLEQSGVGDKDLYSGMSPADFTKYDANLSGDSTLPQSPPSVGIEQGTDVGEVQLTVGQVQFVRPGKVDLTVGPVQFVEGKK